MKLSTEDSLRLGPLLPSPHSQSRRSNGNADLNMGEQRMEDKEDTISDRGEKSSEDKGNDAISDKGGKAMANKENAEL